MSEFLYSIVESFLSLLFVCANNLLTANGSDTNVLCEDWVCLGDGEEEGGVLEGSSESDGAVIAHGKESESESKETESEGREDASFCNGKRLIGGR